MESHEEAHVKLLMDQRTCAGYIYKKWMFIPNLYYKNMENSYEIAGFWYISLESGRITLKLCNFWVVIEKIFLYTQKW